MKKILPIWLIIILCISSSYAQDSVVFKEVSLDGKLVTAEDPVTIGDNFQQLTNMRYRRTNPYAIGGMTEINTTAVYGGGCYSHGFVY